MSRTKEKEFIRQIYATTHKIPWITSLLKDGSTIIEEPSLYHAVQEQLVAEHLANL